MDVPSSGKADNSIMGVWAGEIFNQFFTSQLIYLGEFNPASKETEVSIVPTRIIYGPFKVLVASPSPQIS